MRNLYADDALEPDCDAETMHLRHDKHRPAYWNNLNAAVVEHAELAGRTVCRADDVKALFQVLNWDYRSGKFAREAHG